MTNYFKSKWIENNKWLKTLIFCARFISYICYSNKSKPEIPANTRNKCYMHNKLCKHVYNTLITRNSDLHTYS